MTTRDPDNRPALCVVGSGISGLTAAYLLQHQYRVTILEKNDYPGGHTHTVEIRNGPDTGLAVDTGFIVMNHRNYPVLTRLFEEWQVPLNDSDMSFSYYDEPTGFVYNGGSIRGLFARKSNLVSARFLRMVYDILRFYRKARRDLAAGAIQGKSLAEYLQSGNFSREFMEDHIIPMGAAIWSTPLDRMMEFPAESFLRFFKNHGLLGLTDRPQWRTVAGGSRVYVRKMLDGWTGHLELNAPVQKVLRSEKEVICLLENGRRLEFDRLLLAVHADEALQLLDDPTPDERRLLGAWQYQMNTTVLHTDINAMPPIRQAWAAWNYIRQGKSRDPGLPSLTYYMNHLQRLNAHQDYMVTLNRALPFPKSAVIESMDYTHPMYSRDAVGLQPELKKLQNVRNTCFCGSYFGYGFHEDGARSGVEAARAMGVEW